MAHQETFIFEASTPPEDVHSSRMDLSPTVSNTSLTPSPDGSTYREEQGDEFQPLWNRTTGQPMAAGRGKYPSTTLTALDKENLRRRLIKNNVAKPLSRRKLGVWLVLLYGSIAVLSWSITCVLCYHPIGIPTYEDQRGNYSMVQYQRSDGWRRAAAVGNQMVDAVGIPITSAICARAAAAYCQRKSNTGTSSLTLRQMLVVADRGWSGVAVLWNMLKPRTSSPFLILAAGLVGINK